MKDSMIMSYWLVANLAVDTASKQVTSLKLEFVVV